MPGRQPDFDSNRLSIQDRGARQWVDGLVAEQVVEAGTGVGGRDGLLRARAVVAPAMGDGYHAGHDIPGHLHRQHDVPFTGTDLGWVAGLETEPGGVLGMDHQGAPVLAFHQASAVVQPGVVAAHVAAADHPQVVRRGCRQQ